MSSIPPPAESVDQARLRLAQKARDSGVKLRIDPDGRWYASSVSSPGHWHYVTGFSCDCLGFFRVQRCMHNSALLACLGWLSGDEPTDPDPMPLVITLAHTGGHYRLKGETQWQQKPVTTILVNDVGKVRLTGGTDGLRVHWMERGQPIDDMTECTPRSLDHYQAIEYWIECLDASISAQSVMEEAGLRPSTSVRDAA